MKPQTVFELFAETARAFPENSCVAVLPETASAYGIEAGEYSYSAMLQSVAALRQDYREAGYGRGQRVGLLLQNRPAFFAHWFALNGEGVSVVPINPDLRSSELEYLISHSELVAIVATPDRHQDLMQAAPAGARSIEIFAPDQVPSMVTRSQSPEEWDEAALLYTSGTTGRPKACVLNNSYFLAAGRWYAEAGGLIELQRGVERMLTPLPLFHMNAMAYSAMAMLCTGGCLIVLDRFHPKSWWHNVRESRASIIHYLGVMPPMLMIAAPSPNDQSHFVRFGFGAGVDRSLHAQFEERFGFPLIEAWAMTETGAGAVVVASRAPRHVGESCFGIPENGVETTIIREDGTTADVDEPGELLVRHAGSDAKLGFFAYYLGDPEATAQAWRGGWFRTGDVVRRAADGSLCFVDRKKNVIRRSGENISAVEVEAVLMTHPEVRQVAVAPIKDEIRGDEVFACVVPHQTIDDPAQRVQLAHEIVAWCLARLAYYKAPGYIAFVNEIPLTTTQKIQRGVLQGMIIAACDGNSCVDTRFLKKRVAI